MSTEAILWLSNWEKTFNSDAELRKEGRFGSLAISLRVIAGGNGRHTPIIEITTEHAFRRSPRGIPTKYAAAEVGPQWSNPDDAAKWADGWLEQWLRTQGHKEQ